MTPPGDRAIGGSYPRESRPRKRKTAGLLWVCIWVVFPANCCPLSPPPARSKGESSPGGSLKASRRACPARALLVLSKHEQRELEWPTRSGPFVHVLALIAGVDLTCPVTRMAARDSEGIDLSLVEKFRNELATKSEAELVDEIAKNKIALETLLKNMPDAAGKMLAKLKAATDILDVRRAHSSTFLVSQVRRGRVPGSSSYFHGLL